MVTYAVELRADKLYACYQEKLKKVGSPVSVRGIIAEEELHLAEMETEIDLVFKRSQKWREEVSNIENMLYQKWLIGLAGYINSWSLAA